MIPYVDIHAHHKNENELDQKEVLTLSNVLYPNKPNNNTELISLHPWYLPDNKQQAHHYLESSYIEGTILGEIGLDKVSKTPWEKQITFFQLAVKFACDKKIPTITLHSVKSHQDCLKIITNEKYSGFVIFHDFFSSREELNQLLKSDQCFFSLGKILRSPQSKLYHDLKEIPLNRLFFETDDKEIPIQKQYKLYCSLTNSPLEEIKKTCYDNYLKVSKVHNEN